MKSLRTLAAVAALALAGFATIGTADAQLYVQRPRVIVVAPPIVVAPRPLVHTFTPFVGQAIYPGCHLAHLNHNPQTGALYVLPNGVPVTKTWVDCVH